MEEPIRPTIGSSEKPETVKGLLNDILWDLRRGHYITAFENTQKALKVYQEEEKSD